MKAYWLRCAKCGRFVGNKALGYDPEAGQFWCVVCAWALDEARRQATAWPDAPDVPHDELPF